MTIQRGNIAAVSYLNTVPFVYGINRADGLRGKLLLSPPSQCVESYRNGQADIALIPVEAIPALTDASVVGRYCLGTNGGVRTVVLMSDHPLESITTIYTDSHSVTSARLVAILCAELWKITPRFVPMVDYSAIESRKDGEAFLLIGDKVFGYEGRMACSYDLSDAWKELTGLPFVFAAWVARKGVSVEEVDELNRALAYGVAHIPQAIEELGHDGKPYALEYLTRNIDFEFDIQKRQALSLFWEKSMKYAPRVNPG